VCVHLTSLILAME